jgi:hypothetical protein
VVSVEDTVELTVDVAVDVTVVSSQFKKLPEMEPSMAAFIKSTVSAQSFNPAVIYPSIVHEAVPVLLPSSPNSSPHRASPAMKFKAAAMDLHADPAPPS